MNDMQCQSDQNFKKEGNLFANSPRDPRKFLELHVFLTAARQSSTLIQP